MNRSLRGAEFLKFSQAIHRDLHPRGPLETLVAQQAIRSAWRLRENIAAEVADPLSEIAAGEADRAARSLEVAITTLDRLQGRRDESALPLVTSGEATAEIEPNEWPVLPTETDVVSVALDFAAGADNDAESDGDEPDEAANEAPIWQDRLVYDFDVSDHSPVIKGTWVTVSHIISLIVDGATWAEILRTHPELTETDLRVCVAYAVAEDNSIL